METCDPALAQGSLVKAQQPSAKWRSLIFWLIAGAFIALIFAASWAPESQMAKLGWVPGWLGMLADRDPNIRTAAPFIPLAFLLMHGLCRLGTGKAMVWTLTMCGSCLVLSEAGQVFLPQRTADMRDLMWGGYGILVGTAVGWMSRHRRRLEKTATEVVDCDG